MCDIVIYGRGKTAIGLAQLLKKQGKSYAFYDDVNGMGNGGCFCQNQLVITSPGVPPTAKGMALAKKVGAKIISELQYCFDICNGKCISVTGTNGKTTTCQIIYHILQKENKSSYLLGNGGIPFSQKVFSLTQNDVVVLESSSFQLDNVTSFAPYISLFTNLALDHLDYHGSFDSYKRAKINNFIYQEKSQYAIFNMDDNNVLQLSSLANGRKLFYSTKFPKANCYFDGTSVIVNIDGNVTSEKSNYLATLYSHNISNCLGAILSCVILGVPLVNCLRHICSYKFLPHRMQKVTTVGNVLFVDDSKGTNVHATITATQCMSQNYALILGGSDKGYPFDEIFLNLRSNCKYICATGQTANCIFQCGKKYGFDVEILPNITCCVQSCYQKLKEVGGVVLMSNACASFDNFNGYEQRGKCFQNVVEELKIAEKL